MNVLIAFLVLYALSAATGQKTFWKSIETYIESDGAFNITVTGIEAPADEDNDIRSLREKFHRRLQNIVKKDMRETIRWLDNNYRLRLERLAKIRHNNRRRIEMEVNANEVDYDHVIRDFDEPDGGERHAR